MGISDETAAFRMTTPDVIVRPAAPGDAPAVEALYRELVGNPAVSVLPERIARIAADPHTELLVAEDRGGVRGSALVTLCLDAMFREQPFAVVENVVVARASRNRGIGSALLARVETLALEARCSKIMLLSSAAREDAHRFFARLGYDGSSKRGFVKYRRAFRSEP